MPGSRRPSWKKPRDLDFLKIGFYFEILLLESSIKKVPQEKSEPLNWKGSPSEQTGEGSSEAPTAHTSGAQLARRHRYNSRTAASHSREEPRRDGGGGVGSCIKGGTGA